MVAGLRSSAACLAHAEALVAVAGDPPPGRLDAVTCPVGLMVVADPAANPPAAEAAEQAG